MRLGLIALVLPSLLLAADAPRVVNAGRGGQNTRNLLARLARDVLAHKPDLVVLIVGTNDMLNSRNAVPIAEYKANLERLVRQVRAAGSQLILLTLPPCHEPYLLTRHPAAFYADSPPARRVETANRVVRALAKKHRLPLVDVHRLITARGGATTDAASLIRNQANSRTTDGVHPTAEGYRAIAAAVRQCIRDRKLPARRVVCLGDSITFGANVKGAGTAKGETYPACLARLLGEGDTPERSK